VQLEATLKPNGLPKAGWEFVAWTENGRSIVPLSAVEDAADLDDLPPVRSMGVLNRDEGEGAITPGLVRFSSPEQAAGYFMLGETTKTSAAGDDRGKTRSPFTQPFFPGHHGQQAARFAELLASANKISTWLMNTGFVGGTGGSEGALKVKIRHSSAMLEALFAGTIAWVRDPDFGYDVVDVDHPNNAALVAAVPEAILRPDRYYAERGLGERYRSEVEDRHTDLPRGPLCQCGHHRRCGPLACPCGSWGRLGRATPQRNA
jgi:phosphoenolpyruvate carboxykinase (ATP)